LICEAGELISSKDAIGGINGHQLHRKTAIGINKLVNLFIYTDVRMTMRVTRKRLLKS
jgi:hypothetical protein|tara:strand:+ start:375 stop:548 length:174 start_codon:yes stop_codon:yes gene_type:complete